MAGTKPEALIEISSEAGRKIGGIYTVIRSKTKYLHKKFGKDYLLIGLYDKRCAEDIKFEEPQGKLAKIFSELEKEGIHCKYGTWTYGNNSRIISVDARAAGERVVEFVNGQGLQKGKQANRFKFLLWKHFGVDSLMDKSWDFTENIVWCWGVGRLVEKLFANRLFAKGKTVLQFHEWISGAALLYCKMRKMKLATVFTTHATVLGRTLSSSGVDVFTDAMNAKSPIPLNAAYNNRIEGKHQLESAAAKNSTVFTTVSETVAQEVEYILGKKPDVITVNGIEFGNNKSENEVYDLSHYVRGELQQFLEACFISYYQQKYDDALLVYCSGRYEFSNKGFDIFIEALGKLNKKLVKAKKKGRKRVFAFVFAPTSVSGPKISIIKNYLLLDKINEIMHQLPETKDAKYVNLQTSIALLKGGIKRDIENMAKGFVKDGERPHINCYNLTYGKDSVINACVKAGLTNSREDAVKVIFYPTYIKPNDGLMNLSYYDVISAMDVGVFPSRYEPFGYTPVEAAIKMGIAVTSDMTGFGRFIMKKSKKRGCGIKVIKMAGKASAKSSDELAKELERLYRLPEKRLIAEKKNAYRMMKLIDWHRLVKNYYHAYEMALARNLKAE